MTGTPEATQPHQPSPPLPSPPFPQESKSHESSASASDAPSSFPPPDEDTKKRGTHIMGPPAAPAVHPDNQKAALWTAGKQHQQYSHHQPYLIYSPVDKPNNNPFELVIHMFNSWTIQAETIARNIWHHLKTGQSVTGTAWGKLNLTAKVITEGGFDSLFKQIFPTEPNEKLKKTFACYLSTTTGPIAGTLYLSTVRVDFCSDRPLCFTAPSGQEAWSYYKVNIPLEKIETVNPVIKRENPSEKYIQIITIDGHDFWFMGFVNFEKATHSLLDTLSDFRAQRNAVAR